MLSVPQCESKDPIPLFGDDLFSAAGITLHYQRSIWAVQSQSLSFDYIDPRTGWRVWAKVDPVVQASVVEASDDRQLFLSLSDRDQLMHLVSPRCLSFMNATILGMLRQSRDQWAAATRLQRQGVLYFGDLTFISFSELVARLGRRGRQADLIAGIMQQMGLAFSSRPAWWVRPPRFYEQTY